MLSDKFTMVSHNFALSCKFALSRQALFRVPKVASRRAIEGCGPPQPWYEYGRAGHRREELAKTIRYSKWRVREVSFSRACLRLKACSGFEGTSIAEVKLASC